MLGIVNAQNNSITGQLQNFVAKQNQFFKQDGLDFLQTQITPATLIFDLMLAMNLDEDSIRLVLGDEVVNEIA